MKNVEWEAIKNNDKRFDGAFYYALSTTKTFCRPSCTSRTPNPKHIAIFKNTKDAEQAGFRPCIRCKPTLKEWQGFKEHLAKESLTNIKKNYTKSFTLKNLSEDLGKNAYYILRSFKQIYGITPLQYLHELRVDKAKTLLIETNMSVTEIAFEVGYNDSTQLSIKFKKHTGLPPSIFRLKER